MKKISIEKNLTLLGVGAFALFSIGLVLTTLVPPLVDETLTTGKPHMKKYTAQELRGRAIYKSEGCVYCHTQQIRHLEIDKIRFGWRMVDAPVSEAWEYADEETHFLGTIRTGPDLARVGGKYSSEWHWAHFKNPRDLGEKFAGKGNTYQSASVMPSFKYLTNQQIKDLTAYIQTLGRHKNWRKTKDGKLLNDYEK